MEYVVTQKVITSQCSKQGDISPAEGQHQWVGDKLWYKSSTASPSEARVHARIRTQVGGLIVWTLLTT